MYRIILKLFLVFSIVSPSLPAQRNYRRYNVDQESFKLYGEDFKSVLRKFRRTPDYLKILQDKLGDLKTSAKEMSLQVLHYWHNKLEDRVNEIIPTTTTTTARPSLRSKEDENRKIYLHGLRRQFETTTEAIDENLQKIQNLDNYKVFDSQLTVSERNSLKDLGFEFAGKIVHSIIENMAPKDTDGTTVKFTHVPDAGPQSGEKETTTSTTHPPEHSGSTKKDDAESTAQNDAQTVQEDAQTVTEQEQDSTKHDFRFATSKTE